MVVKHEGYRKYIYTDTTGHRTIGHGINLEAGLTREESLLVVEYRLNKIDEELSYRIPFYNQLSAIRQDVLCDMAYNLGINGLLGFRKMLASMEDRRWGTAAREMLDSRWARQVGLRAEELADLMRSGVW